MATLLQFPVRRSSAPIRSHDSLARDTQSHASRIAQQVEQEMARKAHRQSVGLRIEFAGTSTTNIVMMPLKRSLQAARAKRNVLRSAVGLFRRFSFATR